jgi:hypothetical protein
MYTTLYLIFPRLTRHYPRLADYIQSEPERKKAQQDAQKAKLAKLERQLGINPDGSASSEPTNGKKRRLDDAEFIEQSRDINDNVRSAVAAGELHSSLSSTLGCHND